MIMMRVSVTSRSLLLILGIFYSAASARAQRESTCRPGTIECRSPGAIWGRCILERWLCDGDNDCGDNSDEEPEMCANDGCPVGYARCAGVTPTRRRCVYESQLCDGDDDCGNNWDEDATICAALRATCEPGYFQCVGDRHRCVREIWLCDGDNDCGDNSDEHPSVCPRNGEDCSPTPEGHYYAGNTSVTVSGRQCQAWRAQYPHEHRFNHRDMFPDTTVNDAGNYCRNPDRDFDEGLWCYTTDSDTRWELCDVPVCGAASALDCINSVHLQCLMPVNMAYSGMSDEQILTQLDVTDLRDTCRPLLAAEQCTRRLLSSSVCRFTQPHQPQVTELLRLVAVANTTLIYVCRDHVDVFNEHKGCLLRRNGRLPAIADAINRQCPERAATHNETCLAATFVDCATDVVSQQCGDEVAGHVSTLGSQLLDEIGCETRKRRLQ